MEETGSSNVQLLSSGQYTLQPYASIEDARGRVLKIWNVNGLTVMYRTKEFKKIFGIFPNQLEVECKWLVDEKITEVKRPMTLETAAKARKKIMKIKTIAKMKGISNEDKIDRIVTIVEEIT